MIRRILSLFLMVALALLAACQRDAVPHASQPEQPVPPAPCRLSISLDNNAYRGGENDQHWHLTRWALRNDSAEPIAEAVVIVTLFDANDKFLGHHGLTFQHVLPGETAHQRRLLLLKSDNIDHWHPRCESVQSRDHGDLTGSFHVALAQADKPS